MLLTKIASQRRTLEHFFRALLRVGLVHVDPLEPRDDIAVAEWIFGGIHALLIVSGKGHGRSLMAIRTRLIRALE